MTIYNFKNPKTSAYKEFKSLVLSKDFPWHDTSIMLDDPDGDRFDSHSFLSRPTEDKRYCTVQSEYIDQCYNVFMEIFDANNWPIQCIFRMNANKTYPKHNMISKIGTKKKPALSTIHVDHPWRHNNLLIYLTNAGGKIVVEDEKRKIGDVPYMSLSHDPKEDDIVQFGGLYHCHEFPEKEPRVVLVATYLAGM